ncbi:MAG: energy transducer TonB [Pseudoxanthomonas suwonensis]|nr:energy transducer TonB [Pseudoxanthomonas suwonensis]
MTTIHKALTAALTACIALGAAHTASAGERLHTWSVGLDGEGRVSSWQLFNGQDGAYADGIAAQLGTWRFEPSQAGSKDMQTFVRVVSAPGGDGRPQVLQVSTGPAPSRLSLPDYPEAAQRRGDEGVVVLRLQLAADGSVQNSDVHDVQGQVSRRMAASAMVAAKGWRFSPERVDGQAVAGEVLFPVCFYVSADPGAVCSWQGPQAAEMSGLSIVSLAPVTRSLASRD